MQTGSRIAFSIRFSTFAFSSTEAIGTIQLGMLKLSKKLFIRKDLRKVELYHDLRFFDPSIGVL